MKISNILDTIDVSGVSTKMLVANRSGNVILISIEKGAKLSEHVSNTDASVIILEGEVNFKIEGESHHLSANDLFSFKKTVVHAVEAIVDSKFLLIK